jgi:hypothetical protein
MLKTCDFQATRLICKSALFKETETLCAVLASRPTSWLNALLSELVEENVCFGSLPHLSTTNKKSLACYDKPIRHLPQLAIGAGLYY